MRTSPTLSIAGIAALFLLVVGCFRLFLLRFEVGDMYPPYSSLRSDPLGAKALYQSLEASGLCTVSRSFKPPEELDVAPDTVVMYLGDTLPDDAREKVFDSRAVGAFNAMMRKGVRVVVALIPRNLDPLPAKAADAGDEDEAADRKTPPEKKEVPKDGKDKGKKTDGDGKPELPAHPAPRTSLAEWLGVSLVDKPLHDSDRAALNAVIAAAGLGLPESLSCHTSACFTDMAPGWTLLYEREGHPVMIERRIGKGSIVLSTLAFFSSNEGLRNERAAALLTWLLGGRKAVIFDETHLGLEESPGVATLMRKYGLFWLIAGLLLLAALYVWQNAFSLVPPYDAADLRRETAAESGRDSLSGLVTLLRRNLSAPALLDACLAEWKASVPRARTRPDLVLKMSSIAALEKDRPLPRRRLADAYNAICRLLSDDTRNTQPKGETP